MKRFVDQNYGSETYFEIIDSGVCVVCPKCQGMGIIKGEREIGKHYHRNTYFKCTSCYDSQMCTNTKYKYQANAVCNKCERYIKSDIGEEYRGHKVLNVVCPHCKAVVPARTQQIEAGHVHPYGISVSAISALEPNFGYELYFLSSYKGKAVFAINRRHLQYLIDYIEADLRESPREGRIPYSVKGHSYQLPKFMKLAKNRGKVLKILRQLQVK